MKYVHDFSGHKAFNDYYQKLADLAHINVTHEQGTRGAFQMLLDTLGKSAGWTLVPEEKLSNRKRPDGTLYDSFKLPRGYWEAKDTADDLDREIKSKTLLQYPLTNTIFEDTRRAVLFQNGREAGRFDLTQPAQLAVLLNKFFNHTEEDIEGFHAAVGEFQTRIPTLAGALQGIIREAHENNAEFRRAFGLFHEVCKSALNPQISAPAIEEMLVQHLLTERLFRTVFDNPQFVAQNVIAAEIETVIAALAGGGFQRQQFLRVLDRFYKAIEDTARTLHDWGEKQGFLNTVYERFFQGWSVNQADTMGIVYTPQPIVDWMCASVERVLQDEFGQSLSTRDVKIVDPCTGTGNFVVNLLRRIGGRDLKYKYEHDIFCNEIMLLPYYIAGLNVERAYFERMGQYLPFPNICFADTLDLNETNLFSEANTERIKREQAAPITVIIGNPPYNVGQKNENDNNKNRKYDKLDRRIKDFYAKASKATNTKALNDPYVKFFRWATDRLNGRDGVVCFVSNNSFLNQAAFDGMRQHLARDFNQIYHLDLHGNVRQNPKLSGTTHNVFGIQVGVGITVAVRKKGAPSFIKHHRVPEDWRKIEKLAWLAKTADINGVAWQTLTPDAKNNWITEGLHFDFDDFLPMGTKEAKAHWGVTVKAVFKNYSLGVSSNRDDWVYDWNREALTKKARRTIDTYNSEVLCWQARDRSKDVTVDEFVTYDDKKIKWSRDLKLDLKRGNSAVFSEHKIRRVMYRPFCNQFLFFDRVLNEEVYGQPKFFPTPESESENQVIWLKTGMEGAMWALTANTLTAQFQGGAQCFPFYTYAEDGSNRTENITDWALEQFRAPYGAAVSKRDIFHYVYAVLHHPQYRTRYAENLKKSLPRIPLVGAAPALPQPLPVGGENSSPSGGGWVGAKAAFDAFVSIGAQLMQLHLNYETAPEYPLRWVETGTPFSWRVEKMKWTADKSALVVNGSLTLEGFPAEAFAYKLGNRSALDWVVDQYQVKTDARSGLTSDPNRADDEEYIARLIGRVTTVSLETQQLLATLPPLCAES